MLEFHTYKEQAKKEKEELMAEIYELSKKLEDAVEYVDKIRNAIPNRKVREIQFKEKLIDVNEEVKEAIDNKTKAD